MSTSGVNVGCRSSLGSAASRGGISVAVDPDRPLMTTAHCDAPSKCILPQYNMFARDMVLSSTDGASGRLYQCHSRRSPPYGALHGIFLTLARRRDNRKKRTLRAQVDPTIEGFFFSTVASPGLWVREFQSGKKWN